MEKQKFTLPEKLVIFLFAFLFISPAFFIKEGPRLLYAFLAGAIGYGIAKTIILSIQRKEAEETKNVTKSALLSDSAISIYVSVYVLISILLNRELILVPKETLIIILKILFSSYILFYGGLKQIQTRKGWLRGFPLDPKSAMVYGVIGVLLALFVLFV